MKGKFFVFTRATEMKEDGVDIPSLTSISEPTNREELIKAVKDFLLECDVVITAEDL